MDIQNSDEQKVLKFWKEENIYQKSKEKNKKGEKFYMMDGPPYATGHIHMGTALNKILKDIAMRSKRLQGFDVFDRAGYDTHGVPIEYQIEKEIGSSSKKDIEKYGIKNFIEKCKAYATSHLDIMNAEFEDLGVWMDFSNPYMSLSDDYIETIWDTFKTAEKKKLLYLGKYPVHICPRCETAVAFNEIEYTKLEDNSIYVKFPIKNREKAYLIIWTTTPWTLPGNTGVMVHPDFLYQEIETSTGERWIIAKDIVPKLMGEMEIGFTVKDEFSGKTMDGWKYENPLSKNLNLKNLKKSYKVVLSSRYVNLEDGTGLVHCAPGHGKEDYEVGKEYNLDMPSPVDINGILTEEAGKYSGKKARKVDAEIIEDLEKGNFLVRKVKYSHDYPLCWRCKSPLLMVSQPQWFLKISKIHERLMKENDKNRWLPGYMKLRMKSWLEGISDWPISRMRYWGTPLPIWICEGCGNKTVVGSIGELKKLSGSSKIGLHKPEIDEIEIPCKKCAGIMKRVPEVLDVWFDSGVSSWAALDYMNNKKKFKRFWPADLNIEGKDQIRGWWNSQLILSTIKFDRKPFDAISVHGMVLDLGKKKMSKSLGNIISPQDIIEKYGRDYLRYYFARTSKGEDFAFDENEFKDMQNVFRVLVNINAFVDQLEKKESKKCIEDEWIISKFNSTVRLVTEKYNSFEFTEAVKILEDFLINQFSKGYVQMIRDRSDEIYETMNRIRIGLLKLFAPIIPFITEKIWLELKEKGLVYEDSIHLTELPKSKKSEIDENLEKEMKAFQEVMTEILAQRDKAQIGLKWPLASANIISREEIRPEIVRLMEKQANIKEIHMRKGDNIQVNLDTKITPELESEGYSRELARKIQATRKKAGLKKENRINLLIQADDNLLKMLEKHSDFIKERVNAESLELKNIKEHAKGFKNNSEDKIKDSKIKICFNIL